MEADDIRCLCFVEVLSCCRIPVFLLVYQTDICNSAISKALCINEETVAEAMHGACERCNAAGASEDIRSLHAVLVPLACKQKAVQRYDLAWIA